MSIILSKLKFNFDVKTSTATFGDFWFNGKHVTRVTELLAEVKHRWESVVFWMSDRLRTSPFVAFFVNIINDISIELSFKKKKKLFGIIWYVTLTLVYHKCEEFVEKICWFSQENFPENSREIKRK